MFFNLFALIILGIIFGTITGLTPGIHINLINSIILSIYPVLLLKLSVTQIVVFIIAMSITHSFLDALPSIFLGAPDITTILSVYPGHRYLLNGEGLKAFKLTLIGSYFAIIFSVFTILLLIFIIKRTYPFLKPLIWLILILFSLFIVFESKHKLDSFLLFLLSGIFGYLVLNSNLKNPLLPLLSGMFGLSSISLSIFNKNKLPKQVESPLGLPKNLLITIFIGEISGFITAIFPGIGSSFAAIIGIKLNNFIALSKKKLDKLNIFKKNSIIFSQNLFLKRAFNSDLNKKRICDLKTNQKLYDTKSPLKGLDSFMILLGSVNTFNFMLSIPLAFTFKKARNGSILTILNIINRINSNLMILIVLCSLITGSIVFILSFFISKIYVRFIEFINYTILSIIIFLFIVFITFIFSGFTGLIILFTSTSIGIFSSYFYLKKTVLMGCLILPVILWLL